MSKDKTRETVVVAAVGTVVQSRHATLAGRIQKAMSDAVRDALAEGIPMSDSTTIRARMMAAREAVKDDAK